MDSEKLSPAESFVREFCFATMVGCIDWRIDIHVKTDDQFIAELTSDEYLKFYAKQDRLEVCSRRIGKVSFTATATKYPELRLLLMGIQHHFRMKSERSRRENEVLMRLRRDFYALCAGPKKPIKSRA